MYVSFKYDDFEGIIDDRYFTCLIEESFNNIINQTNFKIDKLWITEDKLDRDVKWLNVIFEKGMVNRMKQLLKQFRDIRDLFSDANHIELTEESYLKYQDILALLVERGYLHNVNADNFIMYYKDVSLCDFEIWLKDQMKESKKIKRREWIIAIVSALVGAVIGLIPTIINLLN